MYRFTLRVLGFLFLMATLPSYMHASSGDSCPAVPGNKEYTYKLRLVFDGLVTLKEPSANQKNAWILIGNASNPDQLQVGKKIPPHMSHLFVRVKDENGVEEAQVSGRPLGPPVVSAFGLPGSWQGTSLDGEDLRLNVDTPTKFELVKSRLWFWTKQPCNPKHWYFFCWENRSRHQRENVAWTVNLSDTLAKLPGNPHDKELQECLTQDTYGCKGSPLLLNGRIKLEKGRVLVNKLFGQGPGKEGESLPRFLLAADRALTRPRAQAEEVAVELDVRGPVEISSRSLDGSQAKDHLCIQGNPARTVEVRIGNHPNCGTVVECQKFTDKDFLFVFNLLNNPLFTDIRKLPVPVQEPTTHPGFNSQCSPSSYQPGAGGGQ
ncbi:MAG TPA: hypothetical protein VIA62_12730 [Thermoanaerobaculia bacterium]|nr:hypothetical protein [Thermoanaerobaculia bacterium]